MYSMGAKLDLEFILPSVKDESVNMLYSLLSLALANR